MNENAIGQKLKARVAAAAVMLLIAMASGCGTGDGVTVAGVGTGGTGSTTSISGKVADGYLVGATVFLDKNGNYQPDTGEPSATTDATGAYTLHMDLVDVGRYPIVAMVTQGSTIDTDTNQPVAYSYVLSMPKDSVSTMPNMNFISPLTSQLREMLETGLYATIPQAMDTLRARMGLAAGTNMSADYIAGNNAGMHSGAQNIATAMGSQMGQVYVTSGSTTTLDVNRYRTMMGMIFSNMSTVMGANGPAGMTNLNGTMTATLSGMQSMGPGQTYQNMSSSFRGMMKVTRK